jgi:acetoin utilization protein AcuC
MISDKSIFAVQKTKQAIFLGSDIFRGSVYGKGHPLNIARVWPVIDICRAFGWLDDSCFETVAPASASELHLFHSADYVAALQDAQTHQALDESRRQRHRIGMDNNPIFPQVYDRPATAAAASMRLKAAIQRYLTRLAAPITVCQIKQMGSVL